MISNTLPVFFCAFFILNTLIKFRYLSKKVIYLFIESVTEISRMSLVRKDITLAADLICQFFRTLGSRYLVMLRAEYQRGDFDLF